MKLAVVYIFKVLTATLCGAQQLQIPLQQSARAAIPLVGFGTWNLRISDQNTTNVVSAAIETGYTHIDCAAAYYNQKAVGAGIAQGLKRVGLSRNDIWVTSKLWNDHHGSYDVVESGLNRTLEELGLDYLDLYLMHWPVGNTGGKHYEFDYIGTWQSMERLLDTGKVKHIGVANFAPKELEKLLEESKIPPAVHQMELHPYLQQDQWVKFHQARGIAVTAYSPLGNMNPTYRPSPSDPPLLLENEVIKEIAEKRHCTPAQVVLAWGMSRWVSVIPKTSHVKYIHENFASTWCHLEGKDYSEITKLGERCLKRFNNPSKTWGVDLYRGLDDSSV